MDAATLVLTAVQTLAKLAPQFVATWNDLQPFANALYQQFKGSAPTDAEQADLEAKIDALAARLQQSLPDAQPGDPDYVPPTGPTG